MSQDSPAPYWSGEAVAETYLDFFQSRGHLLIPSSSLIPENDPTVLLTTAGMQQFVPYMLGRQAPASRRLCSVQKCFRTTDIDTVGNSRNLTFFEMLGNFSIGDYFKEQMIPWALELITEGFGVPLGRLWVTVHPTDEEARRIWESLGVPIDRIVPDEENFWGPPGSSGPCGPDTELYFDRGPALGCGREGCAPGCDCDRYLEFWNLVFMQYLQDADGARTPLGQRNIDTGAGLERVTSLLQGTLSVYETDLFLPLVRGLESLAGATYGSGGRADYALRVLADHGRAMTFLVGDGVLPSNEGRGYVLRRILRRAVRYGRHLGIERPFLSEVVDLVINRMAKRYPALEATRPHIRTIVKTEEQRFLSTLQSGLSLLDRWIEELKRQGEPEISGERIFRLYDTYGFPRELSQEIVEEDGLGIRWDEYDEAMAAQRERSRGATRFRVSGRAESSGDLGAHAPTVFIGDAQLDASSPIVGLERDEGSVRSLGTGQPGQIILAETPFYAEAGGQVGDTGEINSPGGRFRVEDTQRDPSGRVLHVGYVIEGELAVGDPADAVVDADRRHDIMRHHSVTHLLHQSLRSVLGPQTMQAGSLVAPHVARFDFPHEGPLEPEQLEAVEDLINRQILADLPVLGDELSFQEAVQQGALAFFGEKYGDRVRVVTMGNFSKELCGGTHVRSTGELGAAYAVGEYGIGSGMRRVEVVAGRVAHEFARRRNQQIAALAARVGSVPDELEERVSALLDELREARRTAARLEGTLGRLQAAALVQGAQRINGLRLVAEHVEARSMDALLRIKDAVQEALGSGIVVLAALVEGRPQFVASMSPDLVRPGFDAVRLVREVAEMTGGSGGGRPELARAGGRDASRVDAALAQAAEAVRRSLSPQS